MPSKWAESSKDLCQICPDRCRRRSEGIDGEDGFLQYSDPFPSPLHRVLYLGYLLYSRVTELMEGLPHRTGPATISETQKQVHQPTTTTKEISGVLVNQNS